MGRMKAESQEFMYYFCHSLARFTVNVRSGTSSFLNLNNKCGIESYRDDFEIMGSHVVHCVKYLQFSQALSHLK